MHPSEGLINKSLELVGIDGPAWLSDPDIALLSVALVDVWKGVGHRDCHLHGRDPVDP